MKLIKVQNEASVFLSDGTILVLSNFTDEDKDFVLKSSDDEIKNKYTPLNRDHEIAKIKVGKFKKLVVDSKIVNFIDNKFTIPQISNVSAPKYLAKRIVKAEMNGDTSKLEGYLNFWTLNCQNTNEIARNNLLWFLETHGFKILKSGLFVAYRNAISVNSKTFTDKESEYILAISQNIKKVQKKATKNYSVIKTDTGLSAVLTSKLKDQEVVGNLSELVLKIKKEVSETTYTDAHTGKMKIQLGKPVFLDRSLCDEDSNKSCSRGLHLAKKDWSDLGSFGNTTLMCLCNPANVVAVPKEGTYGKIRTCEYFPVEVAKKKSGKIIETIEDGVELDYFNINYDGIINDKEANEFQINIPLEVEDNYKVIKNLQEIKDNLDKARGSI